MMKHKNTMLLIGAFCLIVVVLVTSKLLRTDSQSQANNARDQTVPVITPIEQSDADNPLHPIGLGITGPGQIRKGESKRVVFTGVESEVAESLDLVIKVRGPAELTSQPLVRNAHLDCEPAQEQLQCSGFTLAGHQPKIAFEVVGTGEGAIELTISGHDGQVIKHPIQGIKTKVTNVGLRVETPAKFGQSGQTLHFVVNLDNTGSVPTQALDLQFDALEGKLQAVQSEHPGECQDKKGAIACSLAPLALDQSVTLQIEAIASDAGNLAIDLAVNAQGQELERTQLYAVGDITQSWVELAGLERTHLQLIEKLRFVPVNAAGSYCPLTTEESVAREAALQGLPKCLVRFLELPSGLRLNNGGVEGYITFVDHYNVWWELAYFDRNGQEHQFAKNGASFHITQAPLPEVRLDAKHLSTTGLLLAPTRGGNVATVSTHAPMGDLLLEIETPSETVTTHIFGNGKTPTEATIDVAVGLQGLFAEDAITATVRYVGAPEISSSTSMDMVAIPGTGLNLVGSYNTGEPTPAFNWRLTADREPAFDPAIDGEWEIAVFSRNDAIEQRLSDWHEVGDSRYGTIHYTKPAPETQPHALFIQARLIAQPQTNIVSPAFHPVALGQEEHRVLNEAFHVLIETQHLIDAHDTGKTPHRLVVETSHNDQAWHEVHKSPIHEGQKITLLIDQTTSPKRVRGRMIDETGQTLFTTPYHHYRVESGLWVELKPVTPGPYFLGTPVTLQAESIAANDAPFTYHWSTDSGLSWTQGNETFTWDAPPVGRSTIMMRVTDGDQLMSTHHYDLQVEPVKRPQYHFLVVEGRLQVGRSVTVAVEPVDEPDTPLVVERTLTLPDGTITTEDRARFTITPEMLTNGQLTIHHTDHLHSHIGSGTEVFSRTARTHVLPAFVPNNHTRADSTFSISRQGAR